MEKAVEVEKAIKANFPGENNKKLRQDLRACKNGPEVRNLENKVAFTASGKAGIEAIAKIFEK